MLFPRICGCKIDTYKSNGQFKTNFASGLNFPEGVGILPDGKILIGDGGSGNVRKFSKFGGPLGNFVLGSESGLQTPTSCDLLSYDILRFPICLGQLRTLITLVTSMPEVQRRDWKAQEIPEKHILFFPYKGVLQIALSSNIF